MAGIFYVSGLLIGLIGAAMVAPALLAASLGEEGLSEIFLICAALALFFAGGLIFGLHGRERRLKRAELMVLGILIFAVVPVFAALPLALTDRFNTLAVAYFEAVSAFTTTGASTLSSVDGVPRAIILWRAMLEWIGGGTSLLAIVLILAPARLGGTPDSPLRLVESGARTERAHIVGTAVRVLPPYLVASLVCFILLAAVGLSAFDAACLTFSTLSTGGFMPRDGGLAVYDSLGVEAIIGLFMFIGATSIVWQSMVMRRRWHAVREHRESYWIAAVAFGFGLFLAVGFYAGIDGPSGLSVAESAWKGLITSISVISTTGFEVREGGFAAVALPLLLAMLMLGGGGFSTAGGIKFYRFGAMLKQASGELARLVHPHGVRGARFGSQPYDLQLMKAIWTGCMAYLGAVAVTLMLLALFGESFDQGLVAAIAALSTAGPVYSGLAAAEGWPAYGQMEPAYLGVITCAMIVGRLEVIAVFALFNPLYWRS